MPDLTVERLDDMSVTTDLTTDQLDEMERDLCEYDGCTLSHDQARSLIAMAKQKEAAESAMGMYACEMSQFADEVEELERERDEASQYARDWRRCAERLLGERDALRAIVQDVADGLLAVNRHDNCLFCGNSVVHRPDCRLTAALVQPTDAGGAE